MKDTQKPFRVLVRRESGYEPVLTVRFEVTDGHGVLVLQRKGRRKEPSPALVHEEHDVSPKALRAGRFIHVLAGNGRRQSYALSRMTEDLLTRVKEEQWTELQPLTEYGFRYLVLDESELEPSAKDAPATVAVPGNAKPAVQPAPVSGLASRARASSAAVAKPAVDDAGSEPAAGNGPSALQRAMAAIRSGRPAPDATEALRSTPRPAPTARVGDGSLPTDVATLQQRVRELELKLAESITRERDLIEILGRWQEREIRH